jgi:predicted nucleic acid-binding protein
VSDVVVDTDVASAILKGQLPESLRPKLAGQRLAVTFVTVGELTQWTYLHRWGPQRRAGLRAFFASVVVVPAARAGLATDQSASRISTQSTSRAASTGQPRRRSCRHNNHPPDMTRAAWTSVTHL